MVGAINLTGVDLILSGTPVPALTHGASFIIVNNDGANAIVGTFTGLTERATITNLVGSGLNATISYIGGDGNNVVITVNAVLPVELLSFSGKNTEGVIYSLGQRQMKSTTKVLKSKDATH